MIHEILKKRDIFITGIPSHLVRIWIALDSTLNATRLIFEPGSASTGCGHVHGSAGWSVHVRCFDCTLYSKHQSKRRFTSPFFWSAKHITSHENVYPHRWIRTHLSNIVFALLRFFALSHLFEKIANKEIPSHTVLTCFRIKTKLFNNARSRLAIGLRRFPCICFSRWVSNL